ncbi:hypothetical protein PYCC9005_000286 [Savitreella phatthalungensis]
MQRQTDIQPVKRKRRGPVRGASLDTSSESLPGQFQGERAISRSSLMQLVMQKNWGPSRRAGQFSNAEHAHITKEWRAGLDLGDHHAEEGGCLALQMTQQNQSRNGIAQGSSSTIRRKLRRRKQRQLRLLVAHGDLSSDANFADLKNFQDSDRDASQGKRAIDSLTIASEPAAVPEPAAPVVSQGAEIRQAPALHHDLQHRGASQPSSGCKMRDGTRASGIRFLRSIELSVMDNINFPAEAIEVKRHRYAYSCTPEADWEARIVVREVECESAMPESVVTTLLAMKAAIARSSSRQSKSRWLQVEQAQTKSRQAEPESSSRAQSCSYRELDDRAHSALITVGDDFAEVAIPGVPLAIADLPRLLPRHFRAHGSSDSADETISQRRIIDTGTCLAFRHMYVTNYRPELTAWRTGVVIERIDNSALSHFDATGCIGQPIAYCLKIRLHPDSILQSEYDECGERLPREHDAYDINGNYDERVMVIDAGDLAEVVVLSADNA